MTKRVLFRHVILKGISSQLVSAKNRVNAGLPTVMAAASTYIAVGTSHGFVLVFDGQQTLKYSLGSDIHGGPNRYGAASCLAFNQQEQDVLPHRLLVGYAKGYLVEYDMTTGKVLRSLEDAHPLGSAIIHARFTDDPSLALICDSGGSVFELHFTRTMGVRGFTSRCIFSGSRGEVCTLQPLSLIAQYPNHRLADRNVVALATISKVIVLTIRPSMKVLFTHALQGRKDTLPLLAWQFVIIQVSKHNKVVDPVLAFGRGSTLHFYQVTVAFSRKKKSILQIKTFSFTQLSENLNGKIVFIPLQTIQLPYTLLNFGWLNTRCLGILDSSETFHLYDVRNQETLETVDLSSDVQLCYGSSFFKGLATGGNVSAAMSAMGERATYGSVLAFTNQLLLLGRQTFHVLVIRSWSERLDYLVKSDRHIEALNLGSDFYLDQTKALVGLKGPRESRKRTVSKKMMNVLGDYLKVCMTRHFPQEGNSTVLREYFEKVVPPCVNLCMVMKKKDALFDQVWEALSSDPFAKAKLIECLESYILSDQLRHLPVPICQELVNLYEQNPDRHVALEACITHLHVTSLDIHQVMNVCWQHGLYDAIIYIYNNGMLDYVTPAEELLGILIEAQNQPEPLSSRQINLGNKLLVYISCCLAGRAYPYGDISEDQVAKVKYDVYTCLTALRKKKATEDDETFPYLKTLLRFDTQGFLNVVSIAFEEPEFNSELGLCQKQRLVDILLQIMVQSPSSEYSPSQIAHLFTFFARQMTKDQLNHQNSSTLNISSSLFEQVLSVLTETPNSGQNKAQEREEWQQALLDLLNAGGLKHFDQAHLIQQAEKAQFHRILELIYETNGEYDKILKCYIDDPTRNMQAFVFAQKIFIESDFDAEDVEVSKKGLVEKSVLRQITSLMDIDAKKTAMIIYHHMNPYIPLVMNEGAMSKRQKFEFLKHILDYKESGSQPSSPVKSISGGHDTLSKPETYEEYIQLMCDFEPRLVSSYLKSRFGSYRLEPVLRICRAAGLSDAQAYLLEQDGRIEEAFQLIKVGLEREFVTVSDTADQQVAWSRINTKVILLIQLCQRNSKQEESKMWFELLESVVSPQRQIEDRSKLQPFKDVVKHVINSALGYVSLRVLIEKIVTDPVYKDDKFGDVKEFFLGMLEMYHYEETVMKSSCLAFKSDIHNQLKTSVRLSNRGFRVSTVRCDMCQNHLATESPLIVFQCTHKYHANCLKKAGCVLLDVNAEDQLETWQCYVCLSTVAQSAVTQTEEISNSETNAQTANELNPDEYDDITNQRVVRARDYLSKMRARSARQQSMKTTVFDDPDFELKLSPAPRAATTQPG